MPGKYLLLIISTLVSLLIAEITLRVVFHKVPGFHIQSQWFTPVDTLYNIRGYHADSNGIFRADPEAADYLHKYLTIPNYRIDTFTHVSWEVFGLEASYRAVNDYTFKNEFSEYVNKLRHKPDSVLDEFEKAVVSYTAQPINNYGFRSIAFKEYTGPRKKILLLGDSFTWGHSTQNITSSFADILLSRGYIVYNTGISGADPEQYLAVAQELIPLLKPDYVVVNFFMGNDIQYYERPVKPYMPFHYMTNSTNLISCPHGVYFKSAKEAYDFVYANYTIPPDNLLNRLCATTVLTTILWKVMCKAGLVSTVPNSYKNYWNNALKTKLSKPACNSIFMRLKTLCADYNAHFLLLPIPELVNYKLRFAGDVDYLFEGIKFYSPEVTPEDYNSYDGHYNEQGHKKHADMIINLIGQHE